MLSLAAFGERAARASTDAELTLLTSRWRSARGFKAFLFGPASGEGGAVLTDIKHNYLTDYRAQQLYRDDPIRKAVSRSWTPILWDARDQPCGGESPKMARIFDLALAAGHELGISAPINGPSGCSYTLVGTWGRDQTKLSNEWRELGNELIVVGLHIASAEQRLRSSQIPALAPRECECLEWTGRGKTAWEISRIIGISERTVNFHLQKAMRRLGVNSKHQAVKVALSNGAIMP